MDHDGISAYQQLQLALAGASVRTDDDGISVVKLGVDGNMSHWWSWEAWDFGSALDEAWTCGDVAIPYP